MHIQFKSQTKSFELVILIRTTLNYQRYQDYKKFLFIYVQSDKKANDDVNNLFGCGVGDIL